MDLFCLRLFDSLARSRLAQARSLLGCLSNLAQEELRHRRSLRALWTNIARVTFPIKDRNNILRFINNQPSLSRSAERTRESDFSIRAESNGRLNLFNSFYYCTADVEFFAFIQVFFCRFVVFLKWSRTVGCSGVENAASHSSECRFSLLRTLMCAA